MKRNTSHMEELRSALKPFARHSVGGFDAYSKRRLTIRVTEGQLSRAWSALTQPGVMPKLDAERAADGSPEAGDDR